MKEGEDHQRDAEYSADKSVHWPAMMVTALIALAIVAAGIHFVAR